MSVPPFPKKVVLANKLRVEALAQQDAQFNADNPVTPVKAGLLDRFRLNDQRVANSHGYPPPQISPALVLEAFGAPIVFQRIFVELTGSICAALMLSHAIGITETLQPESGGWFALSKDDWQREVGLTRFEQESARRVLRDRGFLIEAKRGAPPTLMYWVDCKSVYLAADEVSQAKWHGVNLT
jgi:hypothetical protein